jgi:hypothetical protein
MPESTFFARVQGDAWRGAGCARWRFAGGGPGRPADRWQPGGGDGRRERFALRRLGRDASGRPMLESGRRLVRLSGQVPADDPSAADGRIELWGVVRWAVHRLWPTREVVTVTMIGDRRSDAPAIATHFGARPFRALPLSTPFYTREER